MCFGTTAAVQAKIGAGLLLALVYGLVPTISAAMDGASEGFTGTDDARGGGNGVGRPGAIGPSATLESATGLSGWKFTSGFSVSAVYSDNADLTEGPDDKQEELFLELQPYFSLTGGSRRVTATGYFAPILYVGTIGGSPAGMSNVLGLDLNSNAELIEGGGFYLDAYAKASTVNLDPRGPGAGLGYNSYRYNSDNLSQVFTVGVSPYTRHHFGSFADLTTRLSLGIFRLSNASESNALDGGISASLNSGADFQRFPWRLYYNITRYNFNEESAVDDGSSVFSSLGGSASYVISPIWRVDSSLGYDFNDYKTTSGETSGIRWSLGGTWTPNPRVALSLGYGGQYYSDNWYLDYRYSHKRVGWFAQYRTELTTYQREYLQSQTFLLNNKDGLPIVDPATGRPIQVTAVMPGVTNETYVLTSFITGIGWTGNRTSVGFDLTRNERDYQVTQQRESDWGAGTWASRQISPDLTASARVSWTSYEDGASSTINRDGSTDRWQGGISLTKRIGARSSVSGSYDYVNSLYVDDEGSSDGENVVALTFNHRF